MTPKIKNHLTFMLALLSQVITLWLQYIGVIDYVIVVISLFTTIAILINTEFKGNELWAPWYGIFVFLSMSSTEFFRLLSMDNIPLTLNVLLYLTILVAISSFDTLKKGNLTNKQLCDLYTTFTIIPIWGLLVELSGMETTIVDITLFIESFNILPFFKFFLIQITKKSVFIAFAAILQPLFENNADFDKCAWNKAIKSIAAVAQGTLFNSFQKLATTLRVLNGTT